MQRPDGTNGCRVVETNERCEIPCGARQPLRRFITYFWRPVTCTHINDALRRGLHAELARDQHVCLPSIVRINDMPMALHEGDLPVAVLIQMPDGHPCRGHVIDHYVGYTSFFLVRGYSHDR